MYSQDSNEDIEKASFTSHCGLVQFICVLFGLKTRQEHSSRRWLSSCQRFNASSRWGTWKTSWYFQGSQSLILSRWTRLAYFTSCAARRQHQNQFEMSELLWNSCRHLGYLIYLWPLAVSQQIIDKICDLELSTNVSKLWSFLRLWNVVQHIALNLAWVSMLRNRKLLKNPPTCFEALTETNYISIFL